MSYPNTTYWRTQMPKREIVHWTMKVTWSDGTEEYIDSIPDYIAREVNPFLDELEESANE